MVYRALGFPPEFFTVLFAVPRAAGYLAHWRESLTDPDAKIARPQQVYQGEWLRAYPALAARPPASSDSMWHVQVSNASRRRLAGGSSSGKEFRPSSGGGVTGGKSFAHPPRDVGLGPAFSSGVVPGDATGGVDKLFHAR